jgi:hypothetical protein
MPIKYGELTIIYNKENILTNLLTWLIYDDKPQNNTKYIFLFDDGEICDSNDKFQDLHFKFCDGFKSVMPLYFEKTRKNQDSRRSTYFYKIPEEKSVLDLNRLFRLYSKYDQCLNIESQYNSIYYCLELLEEEDRVAAKKFKHILENETE